MVVASSVAVVLLASTSTARCTESLDIEVDHDNAVVTLSWPPVPGAGSYHVQRILDGGTPETVALLPGTVTSYVDDPAPEGVLTYRVAADGTPSDLCPAQEVHIGGDPGPTPGPQCVENLAATALPGGSIRLTWTPVAGATSYDVLRATGSGTLAPFAVVAGDTAEFTDLTTSAGDVVRYAVSANGLPGGPCEAVTITAIPVFTDALVGVLALAALMGAYVVMRRR